eukprot:9473282-Heterocapsa_arctica.AAC.1
MLRRIQNIRRELPRSPNDIKAKLQREIAEAESRAAETLVHSLPAASRVLHVFVEVSADMRHLALVGKQLAQELPDALDVADV